jgi:hypothetical protein
MTITKHDTFSGDGQNDPDDVNGQKGDKPSEASRNEAVKDYDAIAYAARTDSIKRLIEEFGLRHLSPEYITFAFNLCDKISITPGLDILRGKRTIWAASIVHAIARLNRLFDAGSELVLTPALICAQFKTNKSTVSNRASLIQKICAIEPGTKGYCRQEIVDAVTFVETVDGFALPPRKADMPAEEEVTSENPAMRILAYRRKKEEENKKLQALLEERKKAAMKDIHIPQEDKQLKLFE